MTDDLTEPAKIDLETPDLTAVNRAAFEQQFPGVLADGVIDAGRLKELLDVDVVGAADDRERYGLMWAGKKEAVRSLQTLSRGTLVPDFESSVDWDTAQNVFIEGDNLEVLKLLQKAYNDQFKVIYIDPPYNTGNDFVYHDDFEHGLRRYLEYTGQVDEEGNLQSSDVEAAGRRHSRWLSMMYPRLVLARNLLRRDGALFVSIDDNEFAQLRQLLDLIFGEENLLGTVCIKMSHLSGMKMAHADQKLPKLKEFLVIYARDRAEFRFRPVRVQVPWDHALSRYTSYLEWEDPEDVSSWRRLPLGQVLRDVPKDEQEAWKVRNADRIFRTAVNDSLKNTPRDGTFREVVTPTGLKRIVYNREEVLFASAKLHDVDGRRVPTETIGDIWTDIGINNLHNEGGVDFPNGKKPLKLLRRILQLASAEDDLVLDFFAGSGSFAHAALEQNASDGGRRRTVSVVLPEPLGGDFADVAELCRTRIARAVAAHEGVGLRVSALATSNFRHQATASEGEMFDMRESTLDDGEHVMEYIAQEVLLKEGVRLDARWERHQAADAPVIVADGVAVVMSLKLTGEIVDAVLALEPKVVVFLEDGFAGADAVKANAFTNAKNANIVMKTV